MLDVDLGGTPNGEFSASEKWLHNEPLVEWEKAFGPCTLLMCKCPITIYSIGSIPAFPHRYANQPSSCLAVDPDAPER